MRTIFWSQLRDVRIRASFDFSLKLEQITLSFNFIVKQDYRLALRNLPHLKAVTLTRTLRSGILSIVSEECRGRLEKIRFHPAGSQDVPWSEWRAMLASQAASLSELDLRDVSGAIRVTDHGPLFDVLSSCARLRRLRLYENMLSEDIAQMHSVRELLVEAALETTGIMHPT